MRPLLLCALALALCGCPDPSKTGKTDDAKTDQKTEGQKTGADEDPLAGSLFSKDELFAIYRAYQRPDDAASGELLRKHRLVDASGQAVATRVEAYKRALKRFAEKDPKGWSQFIESLAQ
ncbi:MAG: hypothetical protein AB7N76_33020 [Planctomycetota bacterium]